MSRTQSTTFASYCFSIVPMVLFCVCAIEAGLVRTPSRTPTTSENAIPDGLVPVQGAIVRHRGKRAAEPDLFVNINSTCMDATLTNYEYDGHTIESCCSWKEVIEFKAGRIPQRITKAVLSDGSGSNGCKLTENGEVIEGRCDTVYVNHLTFVRHGCHDGHNAYIKQWQNTIVAYYCTKN